jgi:hypothetical protein
MAVRHTKRRRAEHNDPFDVLPDEMLCYILIDNLDDAERMAAYSVSLRWRSIIRHEYNRRGRRAHSFCRRVSALKVILRRGLAGNIGLIEWLHTVAPLPNSMNCNCRCACGSPKKQSLPPPSILIWNDHPIMLSLAVACIRVLTVTSFF